MRASALLDLAAELLRQVLRFDQPADALLAAFFRQRRNLGPRERHALAETAYAVLRRRLLFLHLAGQGGGSGTLARRLALLAWQGGAVAGPDERLWLDRVRAAAPAAFGSAQPESPPDALPDSPPDALQDAPQDAPPHSLPDALRHNLPDWLADTLQRERGADFWPLADALLTPAPLDLRVNTVKARRDDVRRALAAAGIDAAPTPFSPWGLRVAGKPALTTLDAYRQGWFEVQDEGSQLLALLTDAQRGEMVVDFCAGAGGKTLALGAAMRNTGRLYAFDVSGHRLDALQPRLARSGLGNVHPARIAHAHDDRLLRLAGKIDRVLVDAPCSGLGTLRRNPDLKWRQSPQAVQAMQVQQRDILNAAARLLKPGGRLVYATCSLLRAENDDIAAAFSASSGTDFVALDAAELLDIDAAAALADAGMLRLSPHLHATDGFFAAVWQRR